jgi:hypothetical protein
MLEVLVSMATLQHTDAKGVSWLVVVTYLLSSQRRIHLKECKSLGKSKIMIMGPETEVPFAGQPDPTRSMTTLKHTKYLSGQIALLPSACSFIPRIVTVFLSIFSCLIFFSYGAISSDEPTESFKSYWNVYCAGMQAAKMRYIRTVKACIRLGHIRMEVL